jgi:hypothetical protein
MIFVFFISGEMWLEDVLVWKSLLENVPRTAVEDQDFEMAVNKERLKT